MNDKKHKKADLEKKRGLFLQLGFLVSFVVLLVVFEWSTPVSSAETSYRIDDIEMETDFIQIKRKEELKPPMPKHFSKIQLISDDLETDDEFEIHDPEIEPDEKIVIPIIQRLPEEEDVPLVFISEKMPEFPGGKIGLKKYIAKNINYPIEAIENDIQGKVFIRFVINSDGTIGKESVIRSIHPLLDKEALRVVRSFPKWKPGTQNGVAVNVWYTVPIVFIIKK